MIIEEEKQKLDSLKYQFCVDIRHYLLHQDSNFKNAQLIVTFDNRAKVEISHNLIFIGDDKKHVRIKSGKLSEKEYFG